MIGWAIAAFAAWEGFIFVKQLNERYLVWDWAKKYREETGKPILLIGLRVNPLHPPNREADTVVDLGPEVLNIPNGVQASVLDLPFQDGQFGCAILEHVAEHMQSVEDVEQAISECVRVADYAFILVPSFWQIVGNRANNQHPVDIWQGDQGQVVVRERVQGIGTVMVFSGRVPEVVEAG